MQPLLCLRYMYAYPICACVGYLNANNSYDSKRLRRCNTANIIDIVLEIKLTEYCKFRRM